YRHHLPRRDESIGDARWQGFGAMEVAWLGSCPEGCGDAATAGTSSRCRFGPPRPRGLRGSNNRLARIKVASPNFGGCDRTLFGYPDDADNDCYDTRAEVLGRESAVKTVGNSNCTRDQW